MKQTDTINYYCSKTEEINLHIQTTTYPGTNLQSLKEPEQRELINSTVARVAQEIVSMSNQIQEQANKDREMLNSGIWYGEDYLDALKHWSQSKRIQWILDKSLHLKGYVNQNFFRIDSKPEQSCRIIAHPHVTPSEALDAALKGPTLIDNGAFICLIHYVALREILGTERFNQDFRNPPINLCYSDDEHIQPLRRFLKPTSDHSPIKKGQVIPFILKSFNHLESFGNHSMRSKTNVGHLFRDLITCDMICIDETPRNQRFIGFGMTPEGISQRELNKKLLEMHRASKLSINWMSKKQTEFNQSEIKSSPLLPFIEADYKKNWIKEINLKRRY